METHRTICMDAYGLDPMHYIGAPGLFWDALLKTTGARPQLMHDACFESVVKHLNPGHELALPNRLDAAQRQDDGSWRRCWVYRQPESHPEVNIFAKREAEVYNAWLEYRRREMDLMKPYSVRSAEVISRSMGVTTRRRALLTPL
eukprot:COSAG03_NODE_590_length_6826_cov_1200.670581_4_plen_145_part_00